MIQPLWRTVWRFLKKPRIKLLYDPTTPLLSTYPDKTITETCIPMFTAALFIRARMWKQPINRCPSRDEWIKQLWYIYSMEYTQS